MAPFSNFAFPSPFHSFAATFISRKVKTSKCVVGRRHAYIYIIYAACKFLSRNYATHGSPFTIGDERDAVVVAKKKRLDSNRERERERESTVSRERTRA